MLHLSGKYYCKSNNIDMSFEANEGPGPVDLKVSRGNDKTVVEIKLSSNNDYLHGFEEQIESYAQAEGTNNRIFVYVMVGNPGRNKKIKEQYQKMFDEGKNPPYLYMIDSEKQTSASNALIEDYKVFTNDGRRKLGLPKHKTLLDEIYLYENNESNFKTSNKSN